MLYCPTLPARPLIITGPSGAGLSRPRSTCCSIQAQRMQPFSVASATLQPNSKTMLLRCHGSCSRLFATTDAGTGHTAAFSAAGQDAVGQKTESDCALSSTALRQRHKTGTAKRLPPHNPAISAILNEHTYPKKAQNNWLPHHNPANRQLTRQAAGGQATTGDVAAVAQTKSLTITLKPGR